MPDNFPTQFGKGCNGPSISESAIKDYVTCKVAPWPHNGKTAPCASRVSRNQRLAYERPGLPGKPDFVFPRAALAVFVDGCFCRDADDILREAVLRFGWLSFFEIGAGTGESHCNYAAQGGSCSRIWECDLKNSTRIGAMLSKIQTLV